MTRKFVHVTLPMIFLLLAGCLDTRVAQKEQEEKQVLRKQITNVQQSTADMNARFQEIEDEQRKLNGRIEATDAKVERGGKHLDRVASAADARIKERDEFYKEELTKLSSSVAEMKAQLAAMQAAQQAAAEEAKKQRAESAARAAEAARQADEAAKNPFATAETKFTNKQWKEAILDYESYRKSNPKGKMFSTATYKIGVCFQELGMPDDAKAFYDEVISRFPGSRDAERAKTRLNGLNKIDKKKR